jgi:oligosaccharyltransferase complex subunit delta (ribophorin II)
MFSLGDPTIKPVQWDAGKITIMHRSGKAPIDEPPTSKHDAMFTVLPYLSHTFRPPQAQPLAAIPLLATALTLVPLLGLFYVLTAKLGANFSALSGGSTSGAAFSVAFLGCIAGALCLGVVFWVRLKLVDLFPVLGGVAVVTVLVGHQALSKMADARMSKEKARKSE